MIKKIHSIVQISEAPLVTSFVFLRHFINTLLISCRNYAFATYTGIVSKVWDVRKLKRMFSVAKQATITLGKFVLFLPLMAERRSHSHHFTTKME